jgi:hypothetical protein
MKTAEERAEEEQARIDALETPLFRHMSAEEAKERYYSIHLNVYIYWSLKDRRSRRMGMMMIAMLKVSSVNGHEKQG